MAASLDTAYVKALVEEALSDGLSGSAVAYVMSGQSPAEGSDAFARLVAVDFAPMPRQQRSGEVDAYRLTATVNVAVGAGQTNAHALAAALRVVADALDEYVGDAVATNGHLLQLERATVHADPDFAEEPGLRTGYVMVEGLAMRESGLTRVTYLS